MPNSKIAWCFVASLLLVGACRKSEQPSTALARVDAETLTLDQVVQRFDTSRGVSQSQIHDYVQQWLTNELLYREAVRRGLDRKPEIDEQLADIRRQLAIQALLENEVYSTGPEAVPDDEIRQYFDGNRDQFVESSDVALLSWALFATRESANRFRTAVVRGAPWSQALQTVREDSTQSGSLLAMKDSSYVMESTIYPVELWRVAVGTGRMVPSFPVRTSDGYYVVIVWKLTRRGEVADFPYVRDDIRRRLLVTMRREKYRQFLQNLRARHDVQVLISPEPSDSLMLMPGD